MEPRYTVALLIADQTGTSAFSVAGVATSSLAFGEQLRSPGVVLEREALGGLLEVPLLPTQADADLLAKLRAAEQFVTGGGRWRCFPLRELHETDDAKLWAGATDGAPLWKGESFDQFEPHGRAERPCPRTEAVLAKQRKRSPGSTSALAAGSTASERKAAVWRAIQEPRIAFRDVTNRTNSRTAIAALLPAGVVLTNTSPYLAFLDEDPLAEMATGVEVGPLEPEERDRLRAEIDARVARAWELTAGELEVVFADFTVDAVPADYRDRVRARLAELA